jgi:hypothetical protein
MKPALIGLTGPARSGKDTIANHLASTYRCQTYAFAWPIKAGVRAMFNLDQRHTDGAYKEVAIPHLGGKSPRELMQTLGTEWGRDQVSQEVWLNMAVDRWRRCEAAGKHLVITDVRFDNEAELIRELGGRLLHISRDDAHAVAAHSSEGGVTIDPRDIGLTNNTTQYDLLHIVDALVEAGLLGGGL